MYTQTCATLGQNPGSRILLSDIYSRETLTQTDTVHTHISCNIVRVKHWKTT